MSTYAQMDNFRTELAQIPGAEFYGKVTGVLGMLVEISGLERALTIGDRCVLQTIDKKYIPCEVIGFKDGHAMAMPFAGTQGIGIGCRAFVQHARPTVQPHNGWLGRVINAFAEPIDSKGALPEGNKSIFVQSAPPPAHTRQRVGGKIDVGVRAMNAFLTLCEGQRMGIFAGSGVGKSTLLSMLARYTSADVNVIGLIGERGREVQEFIEDDLGDEGLKKSVLVVATGDESPLMRRQAAYLTLAVAEYFAAQGKHVLCLMDSVTRFAMALREIGLAMGEPPASKGYTPSVFAELPKLLERAGPGAKGNGAITGLFTVLVEGDDTNEPIADAVRGIIDGHIILDRAIAERGRFPAINILRSVSRVMPDCNSEAENLLVGKARRLLSIYENMAELIRLGAYRRGSDAAVDEAIHYHEALEAFLRQGMFERTGLAESYAALSDVLNTGA